MAFSKPLGLLLAVLAATAMSAAGDNCPQKRKITVQNLCGHDLALTLTPLANSPSLFGSGYVLRHGTHAEFPVCIWTGRLSAPGAPVAEFHVAPDGGAWYQVSNAQSGPVRVSVTPHGQPLQGHCPTAGCADHGRCFAFSVPGGNCHSVDELKIIYYSA